MTSDLSSRQSILVSGGLPIELAENLRRQNPWWSAEPAPPVPPFHRWAYRRLFRLLHAGLSPATVVRGPRRVGKTVLLRQIIRELLAEGVDPRRILYVPFDELPSRMGLMEPVLAIARWHEKNILKKSYHAAASEKQTAYLFFDEIQNLDWWAPQIKHLVDNYSVRAMLTGSSSLRIEAGSDSLAGRITTVDLGPLALREIHCLRSGQELSPFWADDQVNGVGSMQFWKEAVAQALRQSEARGKAFRAFSERGAYPIAHAMPEIPWPELAANLNETVIKRAIQHDLRRGARGRRRDGKLLEEVFRLCCRYAGQSPGPSVFVPDVRQALQSDVGWNRILTYMDFLDRTLLIRLVQPLELRLKRQKSPSKICLCDHSLRASWMQEVIPLAPEELQGNQHLTDLAGHLAESTLGYFFASIPNLDVAYFPARGIEPEVDFVLTVGTRRIPVEVKYRRRIDDFEDTRGIRSFLEKTVYNAPFGLLVTLEDGVSVPDPRIVSISLSQLLWLR